MLDVSDGAGRPHRGHGHGAGADAVLHVEGHQSLPGKDIIVKTIEEIHLEIYMYQSGGRYAGSTHVSLCPLLGRNLSQTLSPDKI